MLVPYRLSQFLKWHSKIVDEKQILALKVGLVEDKVTKGQGRPVNEALNEFFVGLRVLYETETGKSAIAGAHFNGKPKTDFEKLIYLGYQIIRPAQNYDAAYKAYERAISRNSQTTE